jgi:hypothetical protein
MLVAGLLLYFIFSLIISIFGLGTGYLIHLIFSDIELGISFVIGVLIASAASKLYIELLKTPEIIRVDEEESLAQSYLRKNRKKRRR